MSSFSLALAALKKGHRVCRSGWNGKGMYLKYIGPHDYSVNVNVYDGLWYAAPWIGMKTADNGFVPWLASQTDLLAEDWDVLE